MKKIVSTLILSLLTGLIFAQSFSIGGRVLDENNEPLIGATVRLKNTYLGTTTNEKGEYRLSKLQAGTYEVMASFIGYENQTHKIQLKGNEQLNFVLKSSAILTDEVVVRAIQARAKAPVAQTNINKQEIESGNIAADVPYQLELTPSVVATSENGTGMGYTNMRIRGTDMTRINVTVNGIPLNDSESQGVFWVNMADFTSSVDGIQIQRGVGTSTNGAASFGASVNFKTSGVELKPYAQLSSSLGSFNTFRRNIKVGTGLMDNKFAMDVRYSKLNSDGWINRGFSDHESMYLSGTYVNNKDLLKAVIMLGEQHTGITWWGVPDYMIDTDRQFNPAGEYTDDEGNQQFYDGQTDNYWQNHYHVLYSHEFNKHLNINAVAHASTGKGYYKQYKPAYDSWGSPNAFTDYGLNPILLNDTFMQIGNQTYVFPDSTIGASDMIRQKWLDNIFYGSNVTLNYQKNKVDAAFGASWNKYDGDHFGLIKWTKFNAGMPQDYEWYNNTGTKTDASAFAKVIYDVRKNLSVYADLQFRSIAYQMEGPDDDLVLLDQEQEWSFLNPKAGFTYLIDDKNKVYASFAIANREPSRADLKDATKNGGSEIPTHETLKDLEFGYTLSLQKLLVNVNFYNMVYDNQLVLTGKLNSVGYPIMTNVKESFRRGVELSFAAKPIRKLEWKGNFTWSQNKIKDYVEYATHYDANWDETYEARNLGTTNISYSPDIIASNIFDFRLNKYASAGFITKYVGSQYIDNTSSEDRMLEAYMVHNFQMQFHIPTKKFADFSIALLMNNVLDTDYISNGYGGNWYEQGVDKSWIYYYPQAGRNFMVKLQASF